MPQSRLQELVFLRAEERFGHFLVSLDRVIDSIELFQNLGRFFPSGMVKIEILSAFFDFESIAIFVFAADIVSSIYKYIFLVEILLLKLEDLLVLLKVIDSLFNISWFQHS